MDSGTFDKNNNQHDMLQGAMGGSGPKHSSTALLHSHTRLCGLVDTGDVPDGSRSWWKRDDVCRNWDFGFDSSGCGIERLVALLLALEMGTLQATLSE